MSQYLFNVVIEQDQYEDGRPGYHAYCPSLKGCHTGGDTYEEALSNVREAIELYVEDLVSCGDPIPVDPLDSGRHAIAVSAPAVLVNV